MSQPATTVGKILSALLLIFVMGKLLFGNFEPATPKPEALAGKEKSYYAPTTKPEARPEPSPIEKVEKLLANLESKMEKFHFYGSGPKTSAPEAPRPEAKLKPAPEIKPEPIDEGQIDKLIADLEDKSRTNKAQDELVKIGKPCIEKLIKTLYSSPKTAFGAAWALIRIGEPATDLLLDELSSCEDAKIAARIRYVLRHIGSAITKIKEIAQQKRAVDEAKEIMAEIRRDKFSAKGAGKIQADAKVKPKLTSEEKVKKFALDLKEARQKAGAAQRATDEARARAKKVFNRVKTESNEVNVQEAQVASKSARNFRQEAIYTAKEAYEQAYSVITPPSR